MNPHVAHDHLAFDATPVGRDMKSIAGCFGWMREKIVPEGK
jgi:hypothetical protein